MNPYNLLHTKAKREYALELLRQSIRREVENGVSEDDVSQMLESIDNANANGDSQSLAVAFRNRYPSLTLHHNPFVDDALTEDEKKEHIIEVLKAVREEVVKLCGECEPPNRSAPRVPPILGGDFFGTEPPRLSGLPKMPSPLAAMLAFASIMSDQGEGKVSLNGQKVLVQLMGHVQIVGTVKKAVVDAAEELELLILVTKEGRWQYLGAGAIYRIIELSDYEYDELDGEGLPFKVDTPEEKERKAEMMRRFSHSADRDPFIQGRIEEIDFVTVKEAPAFTGDPNNPDHVAAYMRGTAEELTGDFERVKLEAEADDDDATYVPADFMDEPPIEEEEVHSDDIDPEVGF